MLQWIQKTYDDKAPLTSASNILQNSFDNHLTQKYIWKKALSCECMVYVDGSRTVCAFMYDFIVYRF